MGKKYDDLIDIVVILKIEYEEYKKKIKNGIM